MDLYVRMRSLAEQISVLSTNGWKELDLAKRIKSQFPIIKFIVAYILINAN